MLRERPGASSFTRLLADCLEEFGRPATLDEIVDAMYDRRIGWTWVGQLYQANLYRIERNELTKLTQPQVSLVAHGSYDHALGYRWDLFDINRPADRRKALRYVVAKQLRNSAFNGQRAKGRAWVIRMGQYYWRNPDVHPRVLGDNGWVDWDDQTRQAEAEKHAEAMRAIDRNRVRRQLGDLNDEMLGAVLRRLASKIPTTKSAGGRARAFLVEIDRAVGDDPAAAIAMIAELVATRVKPNESIVGEESP